MIRTTLAVLSLVAAALAQSVQRTAHPQDNPHVGTAQLVPFSDDASFCEARSQLLFPARYLPGPGAVLVGMEVNGDSNGTAVYPSLRVTVSPIAASAPRSGQFSANLPQPTVVMPAANRTVTWVANAWQTFTFTQPYVHDGASDLTLDLQKVATPGIGGSACSGLFRPDLTTMLVAYGGTGSGANTATLATVQVLPIDVRLLWTNVPTHRLRSPVPGSLHHGFALGSTLAHVVDGVPGALFVVLASTAMLPAPTSLPPVLGQWRVSGVVLPLGTIAAGGSTVQTQSIPNLAGLVGMYLAYQAITLEQPGNIARFSNASDCFLAQ